MRATIFTILVFLFSSISSLRAQDGYTTKLGPKVEVNNYAKTFPIKADKNGDLYCLSVKPGEEVIVNRYDKNLAQSATERISIDDKFGRDDFTVMDMGDKTWLIYKIYDKATDKQWLYTREIDVKNVKLSGDRKMLLESEKLGFVLYKMAYNSDSSKLLVIAPCYDKKAKVSTQYYAVLNGNMAVVEKKQTSAYPLIGQFDIQLNEAGDIAFILRNGLAYPRNAKNEETVLYVIKAGSNAVEETKLSSDGSKLNEVRIMHDKEGYLLIGTHNESGTFRNMNAIWIRRLNNSKQLVKFGVGDFAVSNDKSEVKGALLHQILFDKAGAVTVVVDCNTNGDMYIMNVAATGQMNWCTKIARSYPDIGIWFGDYYIVARHKLFVVNGEYYFLYMDNKENIGKGKSEPLVEYEDKTNGALACVKLSAGGRISKEYIWQVVKGNGVPVISEFAFVAPNKIVNKTVLMKRYITELKQIVYSEDPSERKLLEITITE